MQKIVLFEVIIKCCWDDEVLEIDVERELQYIVNVEVCEIYSYSVLATWEIERKLR